MKSVIDYARVEYPNHRIEVWSPDGTTATTARDRGVWEEGLELSDHTVIAVVIGADATRALARQMFRAGWQSTLALLVSPNEPTVIAHEPVDHDSVADLPHRRVLAAAMTGAVIGALIGVLGGLWLADGRAAIISGVFGAICGGVVAAIIGGFGRHAGNRAWSQPNAPGRVMGMVAVRTEGEAAATRAAQAMSESSPHDVRIVSSEGRWHAPNTFSNPSKSTPQA